MAFGSQEEPLKALADKHHRNIARCLCIVAESIANPPDRSQYIARVMGNIAGGSTYFQLLDKLRPETFRSGLNCSLI